MSLAFAPMAAAQHQGGSEPVCDEIPQDPIASVIATQEQVFDALFVLPRSDEDWSLSLDGPTHQHLSYADGWTSGGEGFDFEALAATTIDLLNSPGLTPDDEQFILDTALQLSVVSGYVRRGGVAVPVSGVVRSWIEPGSETITHDFVIMMVLDSETINAVEELVFQLVQDGAPCGGISVDSEYFDCRDLVTANASASFNTQIILDLIATGATGFAIGTCIVTLGTGCLQATSVALGLVACQAVSHYQIRNEWAAAQECCCISQRARNRGDQGASPIECEATADWPGICNIF